VVGAAADGGTGYWRCTRANAWPLDEHAGTHRLVMKAAELTSKYVAHLLASQEKHQNEGDQLQGAEDSHDCDKSGIEIFPQCAVIQFIKCLDE